MSVTTERPDYVTCALLGTYEDGEDMRKVRRRETWCGREGIDAFEFVFLDVAHASLVAKQGGFHLLCPGCAKAIVEVVSGHAWDGKWDG